MSFRMKFLSSTVATAFFLSTSGVALAALPERSEGQKAIVAESILLGDANLREELLKKLDDQKVSEQIATMGVSKEEVRSRLAAMSDSELRQVLHGDQREAGGEVIVIGAGVLLVILLLFLLFSHHGDSNVTVVK